MGDYRGMTSGATVDRPDTLLFSSLVDDWSNDIIASCVAGGEVRGGNPLFPPVVAIPPNIVGASTRRCAYKPLGGSLLGSGSDCDSASIALFGAVVVAESDEAGAVVVVGRFNEWNSCDDTAGSLAMPALTLLRLERDFCDICAIQTGVQQDESYNLSKLNY